MGRLALVCALWAGAASPALCNPLYLGRYGGLRGGPAEDGAWALYWNPAGLARPQARIGLHLQAIARVATYDRPAEGNEVGPGGEGINSGRNEVASTGLVPALAVGYGLAFGDLDVGFGAGFYVAQAGRARWNKTLDAPAEHPGAVDGPQRWASISTDMRILSFAGALALRWRPYGISIGASPVYTDVSLSTLRAGTPNKAQILDDDGALAEGRLLFEDGTSSALRWIVGTRWAPRDDLALVFTWHQGYDYTLRGRAYILFGTAPETTADARLNLPVADTLRLGSRIDVLDWLTLRPTIEYANWSVMDEQRAVNEANGEDLIVLLRDFEDTYGFTADTDFKLHPAATLHVRGAFETGATPTSTHEPGLAEADNWQIGLGASFDLHPRLGLTVSYIFHHFMELDITDSRQRPPTNGHYTDQRHYGVLDLEIRL